MDDKRNDQAIVLGATDLDQSMSLPKLVLASASPRRAEILRIAGWDFEILPAAVDETRRDVEDATSYVERLAREKAEEAAARAPNRTILAADTTVVADGEILEKPRDAEDARRMLRLLQDRWHKVLTGICVISGNSYDTRVAHETTEVKFAAMTDDEIIWYVSTGEPMDKAGAYAIQGLGARFIEAVRGDYLNVVGLPLRLLYKLVMKRKG
jgi:septum formation protein